MLCHAIALVRGGTIVDTYCTGTQLPTRYIKILFVLTKTPLPNNKP
jgi:hypothetical protein